MTDVTEFLLFRSWNSLFSFYHADELFPARALKMLLQLHTYVGNGDSISVLFTINAQSCVCK